MKVWHWKCRKKSGIVVAKSPLEARELLLSYLDYFDDIALVKMKSNEMLPKKECVVENG